MDRESLVGSGYLRGLQELLCACVELRDVERLCELLFFLSFSFLFSSRLNQILNTLSNKHQPFTLPNEMACTGQMHDSNLLLLSCF